MRFVMRRVDLDFSRVPGRWFATSALSLRLMARPLRTISGHAICAYGSWHEPSTSGEDHMPAADHFWTSIAVYGAVSLFAYAAILTVVIR